MVASLADRIAVVAGAGLVVYGVWQIFVPAAYILAGCLLLVGAIWRKL
jgi:hypothetical protein